MVSLLKIIALVINIAVVVYLLAQSACSACAAAGAAEEAQRERDVGWAALERTAPPAGVRA